MTETTFSGKSPQDLRDLDDRRRREPAPTVAITHGHAPADLIQFNGPAQAWKLNLDVNAAGKRSGKKGEAVEKSAKTLAGGFVLDGQFDLVENGTAVRFRSYLDGATTDNSSYPRTELREMRPDDPSKSASWDISAGRHGHDPVRRLTAQVKVTHAPSTPHHKGLVIGQIHTEHDDLLEIMYDGEKKAVGYRWPDPHGRGIWQPELLVEDYSPGQAWFTYRVVVRKGTVEIAVDTGHGFLVKATKKKVSAQGCFFKAGTYTQSSTIEQPHDADKDDYGEALFRSVVVETDD